MVAVLTRFHAFSRIFIPIEHSQAVIEDLSSSTEVPNGVNQLDLELFMALNGDLGRAITRGYLGTGQFTFHPNTGSPEEVLGEVGIF